jgi:hypothetical protein
VTGRWRGGVAGGDDASVPNIMLDGGTVYWENSCMESEIDELHRFRLKLIGFLRLPLNISEPALREVLKATNVDASEKYIQRFNRVAEFTHRSNVMEAREAHNQP